MIMSGEKMFPMTFAEGATDDEMSASLSESDSSIIHNTSITTVEEDQSESNSESNNDASGTQVAKIQVNYLYFCGQMKS